MAGGKSGSGAAHAPDNNRRLAFLETAASALAKALVAGGFVGAGEESQEHAFEVAKVELGRLAKMDANWDSLSAFIDDHKIARLEGEAPVHTAIRVLDERWKAGVAVAHAVKSLAEFVGLNLELGDQELPLTFAERLAGELLKLAQQHAEAQGNEEAVNAALNEAGLNVCAQATELVRALAPEVLDTVLLVDGELPAAYAARLLEELRDGAGELLATKPATEAAGDEVTRARILELERHLADAEATIAKFDQAAGKAQRKGKRSTSPRAIGPAETDREALLAAMEGGDELEIVFSDGHLELVEFDPITCFAAAFNRRGSADAVRFDLRDPVLVRGAGMPVAAHGAALLAGGKQVAWCGFPDPVKVPVGQEVRFARMIVFA